MGYPKETKGYYFYNRSENKIIVARDGVFLEKEFLARGSIRNIHLDEIQEDENEIIPGGISSIPRDVGNSGSREETQDNTQERVIEPEPEPPTGRALVNGDRYACWLKVVKYSKGEGISFYNLNAFFSY